MTGLGRRAAELTERFDDHESLFFEGTWHRSHALAGRARRAARGLVDLGVRPGDRVVVCMANCPEVGLAYQALWRAGAVPTPVLFLLTEDELRHVVSDSGAVAAITTPEFLPKVAAAMGSRPVVVVGEGGTASWAELETAGELPLVDRSDDDLAALLYTGGTTGRSKGVALRHGGLDAAGRAAYDVAYREGRTTTLLPLPLAHVYGLLVSVAGLHAREPGRSVLQRWFDPVGFLDLVEQHQVHNAACVPAMLQALLAQPLEQRSMPSWERVSSGGAPLPREVAEELERRVPGLEVREGYGCTETSALVSAQPLGARRLGSVGKPVPGVEVRIDAPPGSTDGEICVRGPLVMAGYWQDPEATAAAVRDGWLHTGDVGRLDDDGYLYVVDRMKDLVIRNGFNVYPRDVEDVLLAHPEVTAAAVVGVPDPKVGEEVVAVVSLAPGATSSPEDLVAFSKQRISAAKYPRRVVVVDAVPLTSVFKTDRKAVRRLLA